MMEEEKNLERLELERKLDEVIKRLDHIERQNHDGNGLLGRNIWVLVPVTAIIMWGLQGIL
ncbi:hypothetical protein F9802_09040 [Bacillus aerolatus]|uniref:Uncharacterized protein n=1 Tax=Bacillus aerolatus TaxID=2653354 RepID=A0A6I1FG60_9BACI|nr:hypothetical protein [Bacillus aerolatus]KAB7707143.1 hypothetical protein F9802_09040 [Bacillus aerolatus]